MSPAFEKIWGRSCASVYEDAHSWMSAIHPDDRARVQETIQREHRPGKVDGKYDVEYRIVRPDGQIRWIHDRGYPVLSSNGTVTCFAGAAEDITDRHNLEGQLRQSQKMESVGQLAGGIAHDFNNLLSVILGYSSIVLDSLHPSDPLREEVVEIDSAGKRAAELTRQLLLFSRHQACEPRILDLNEVILGMQKMLQRILGEDVKLVIDASVELGRVMMDPSHVEQVLMNLVVNARDAMPTGGLLTVVTANAELDEGYARSHRGSPPAATWCSR